MILQPLDLANWLISYAIAI